MGGKHLALLLHALGEDAGGVGTHGALLARELSRRGHRVSVLALDGRSSKGEGSLWREATTEFELWRMAYRFGDVRVLDDLLESTVLGPRVEAWVAERDPDWVHVHHLTGFGTELLRRLRGQGVPVLLTLHDYWVLCPRGQMIRDDLETCERALPARCGPCLRRTWPHLFSGDGDEDPGVGRSEGGNPDEDRAAARTARALADLRLADRCLAPSEAVRRRFLEAGLSADRIFVSEPGIDGAGLRAAVAGLRRKRTRSDDPAGARIGDGPGLTLGILGSVLPSKGVPFLARLLRDRPGLDLRLRIHGPLQEVYGSRTHLLELESIAASDRRISIEGPYSADALAEVLAALDGVAAPALWDEAFGLTVREARAVGLPVLVSDRGGLRGALPGGKGGIVLPAGDPAAWGAALERFAKDPAWRRELAEPGVPPTSAEAMAAEVEAHGLEIL